jgi:hypothetical protein
MNLMKKAIQPIFIVFLPRNTPRRNFGCQLFLVQVFFFCIEFTLLKHVILNIIRYNLHKNGEKHEKTRLK